MRTAQTFPQTSELHIMSLPAAEEAIIIPAMDTELDALIAEAFFCGMSELFFE